MERFNELFDKLKNLSIIQTKGDWAENLPDDIWNEYLNNNFKEVKHSLDVETHRWYETSITVIDTCGGLLGIEFITNMFSESQDYEDCYHTIEFYKMKEKQITSYVCAD